MAAQRGKDLLIRISTASGFLAVAGLRARQIAFNAETVDVNTLDSEGGWRELLAGAGVRSAALSGSGVVKDEATSERLRALFFAGAIPAVQVIVPGFGAIEGPFQIAAIDYAGTFDGEATFEVSLASAGALAFSALGAP